MSFRGLCSTRNGKQESNSWHKCTKSCLIPPLSCQKSEATCPNCNSWMLFLENYLEPLKYEWDKNNKKITTTKEKKLDNFLVHQDPRWTWDQNSSQDGDSSCLGKQRFLIPANGNVFLCIPTKNTNIVPISSHNHLQSLSTFA